MKRNRSILVAALAALALSPAAWATDAGITVNGSGQATGKPTSVELSANVSADAELTADGVVKFNDARKKALDALNALKLAGLTIEPQGMSISTAADAQQQMRMMNGMGATPTKAKTRVSEDLKLSIGGIDKMKPTELSDSIMKVIDAGRDAGLTIGPKAPSSYYEAQMQAQNGGGGALATFRLDDAEPVRQQAYQRAIADAKTKAEQLAKLAGVTLGPVVAIQDTGNGNQEGPTNIRQAIIEAEMGVSGAPVMTARSPKMGDIEVKVSVVVQFAINK